MGRWSNKYVIGLTGNIAMGKSVVRKMLEHLGAYTIDADGLAHQTMIPGAPAYKTIVDSFGRWILDADGKINRSKLGAVVFSHPEALALLESLTHPLVGRGIDTLVTRATQPVVVIEAIKLLEGSLAGQVDTVWVVDADPTIQVARLKEKRGMPDVEANKRISGQNAQRDKLTRANVVITNNGTLQDLWVQVEREWKRLPINGGVGSTQDNNDRVGTMKIASQPEARPAPSSTIRPVQPAATPPASQIRPIQPPSAPARQEPNPSALVPPPTPAAPIEISVEIRRGMPRTADLIAEVINTMTGQKLTRVDIMQRFGEKSYLLAEVSGKVLGVAGFQVENLITRLDEFFIVAGAPVQVIAQALIQAVENASKELQSEVGFVFVPPTASSQIVMTLTSHGYERMEIEQIKVPAWREAAQESQPANTIIFAKKLRAERVLKPL